MSSFVNSSHPLIKNRRGFSEKIIRNHKASVFILSRTSFFVCRQKIFGIIVSLLSHVFPAPDGRCRNLQSFKASPATLQNTSPELFFLLFLRHIRKARSNPRIEPFCVLYSFADGCLDDSGLPSRYFEMAVSLRRVCRLDKLSSPSRRFESGGSLYRRCEAGNEEWIVKFILWIEVIFFRLFFESFNVFIPVWAYIFPSVTPDEPFTYPVAAAYFIEHSETGGVGVRKHGAH